MGRKSIAPLRKLEILEAYEACIKEVGFAQSTTRKIAEVAGIKQPMIAHYFGNREALVEALVQRIIEKYTGELQAQIGDLKDRERLQHCMHFLFGSGVLGEDTSGSLIGHLLSAAKQDDTVQQHMKAMYALFTQLCFEELKLAFPSAPTDECQSTAYGIICLTVGNDAILSTGLPYINREKAQYCAAQLIKALEFKAQQESQQEAQS